MNNSARWLLLSWILLTASAAFPDTPFGLIISEQLRTSFTLVGSGARAAGMGGAFTAVADDATAASFNPAGLAQLVTPEASLVLDQLDYHDSFHEFMSHDQEPPLPLTDTQTNFRHSGLNFLSVTLPFRFLERRWAVQVCSQETVDFTYFSNRSFQEIDPAGNPLFDLRQISDQSGNIRTLSFSAAVEATQRMLLGITLNRWSGNWSFSSFNSEGPSGIPDAAEYFQYSQDNSLYGWNVDLGILLRYRYLNVGARYRTSFSADYTFSADLETNIQTPLVPSPETLTQLKWPSSISVGAALKPSDRMLIAVDWGRTDWSKMMFLIPGNTASINFFDLQPAGATSARVSHDWRAGFEFLLFAGQSVVPLRAGAFREPQPSYDIATGERLVAEGFSAGIGFKRSWFGADFAFQQKRASGYISRFLEPDEIAEGKLQATSTGRLQRTQNRFFLALIVQIPEGSGLQKVIREIFVRPSNADPGKQ